MYLIRDLQPSDHKQLMALARALDTVNLPPSKEALGLLIDRSARSFTGRIKDPLQRQYVFVLEDQKGKLVGTSMIIAQHGTREEPHVFFNTYVKEHYSVTLDLLFKHQVLSIRYNYDGPTEIGGLVVLPARRGQDKPGKQISYVRFLLMAMHPERFREGVLAELLPPLLPDGRSRMWEYLGARFTGLTYQEADELSRHNKEFIRSLFPQGEIYTTTLPKSVVDSIGKVGPLTVGVKRMLERIGFRYARTIDPFDGGPHFVARLEDITLVQQFAAGKLSRTPQSGDDGERLVAAEPKRGANRFRAVRCPVGLHGGEIRIPEAARDRLKVRPGTTLHTIPFD